MAKYLKKLREQAIIEWKNDDLKKVYETQRLAPDDADEQLELTRNRSRA